MRLIADLSAPPTTPADLGSAHGLCVDVPADVTRPSELADWLRLVPASLDPVIRLRGVRRRGLQPSFRELVPPAAARAGRTTAELTVLTADPRLAAQCAQERWRTLLVVPDWWQPSVAVLQAAVYGHGVALSSRSLLEAPALVDDAHFHDVPVAALAVTRPVDARLLTLAGTDLAVTPVPRLLRTALPREVAS